jgi:dihydroneopterin aldolase
VAAPGTTIYLVRHGEVRGVGEVFYGHEDLPLSERGLAQAGAVSQRLRSVPLAAAYTSDLSRCLETARMIAAPHGLEAHGIPALREMCLGLLEGVSIEEARVKHASLAGRPYASMVDFAMPGGGESLRDVASRALPAISALVERHAGRNVLLVGHQSVNRIYLSQVLGLPLEGMFGFGQDFGCLNIVRYRESGPRVMLLNEAPEAAAQVAGDRIRVTGIAFAGRHGWLEAERATARPFRADLVARLPLGAPARSDEIEDTVDYRALSEAVVEVGTTRSYRLLEALCEGIGEEVLRRFPSLLAVEVTVHKPDPELPGEPAEVSVSRFLRRSDA